MKNVHFNNLQALTEKVTQTLTTLQRNHNNDLDIA